MTDSLWNNFNEAQEWVFVLTAKLSRTATPTETGEEKHEHPGARQLPPLPPGELSEGKPDAGGPAGGSPSLTGV